MENTAKIHTYKEAKYYLRNVLNINLLNFTQEELKTINAEIIFTKNPQILSENFRNFSSAIIQQCTPNKFKCNNTLGLCIESIFLYKFHDSIMKVLYENFKDEDDLLFEKCLTDCKDARFSSINSMCAIHLPASIVELANLDSYKTVLEKMHCLSTCYDLIYAEIKLAMVEIIAETDNFQCEIPVVNENDIIAPLMQVIVKSKLKHFISNLYFIEMFSNYCNSDKDCRHVLDCFKKAVKRIVDFSDGEIKDIGDVQLNEIDLMLYNGILLDKPECLRVSTENQYFWRQLKRVANLITKSLKS